MRIVTWNINGIRTFKGRIKNLLDSLDADIICVQETKVTRDLLEAGTAIVDGYNSYFSYSRGRSGYSGVATYCKDCATPFAAEEGLSGVLASHEGAAACYGDQSDFCRDELQLLDNEGRAIITQHKIMCGTKEERLTVINVYCPRADPEKPERKQFKLQFYKLLQCRAEALLKDGGHVIVLGDVNTSHRTIDHCDPTDIDDFDENPGRKWLNGFLGGVNEELDEEAEVASAHHSSGGKFVDTFRYFHPTRPNAFTCWSTLTGARHTNYGTRIDYIFADCQLVNEHFVAADIMPEVEGSDHCPVWGQLSCSWLPSSKPPPLCTCYLPEFVGKQQKLSRFLVKVEQRPTQSEQGDVLPGSQEEEEKRENLNPVGDQNVSGNKRPSSSISLPPKGKKAKLAKMPPNPQGSLLSFFKPKLTNVLPSTDAPEQTIKKDGVKISKNSPKKATTSEEEFSMARGGDSELVGNGSPQLTTDGSAETKGRHVEPKSVNLKPAAGTTAAKKGASSVFWKSVLCGPPPPPSCKVHGEPCVLRTVKKEGPNMGKQFFVCCRPQGHASNPDARCNFFAWVEKPQLTTK